MRRSPLGFLVYRRMYLWTIKLMINIVVSIQLSQEVKESGIPEGKKIPWFFFPPPCHSPYHIIITRIASLKFISSLNDDDTPKWSPILTEKSKNWGSWILIQYLMTLISHFNGRILIVLVLIDYEPNSFNEMLVFPVRESKMRRNKKSCLPKSWQDYNSNWTRKDFELGVKA